jgi:predicted metal-dependent peptidase
MDAKNKQEVRLKRAHIALMKHNETALYSGVMLMGDSEVVEGARFTAYTDGVNKRYAKPFLETVDTEPKLRGLVLHENLHVALKHIPRGKDMFEEDAQIANMAADFVVNDIIFNIKGTVSGGNERIVQLPDGALHDEFFRNWNMREVYNHIRKENPKRKKPQSSGNPAPCDKEGEQESGGQNSPPSQGGTQDKIKANGKEYDAGGGDGDEHDWQNLGELTHEQAKELNDKIDKALREGGMLAGRMGGKIPRAIGDLLEPKIDWREALRDFVSSATKGKDEFTWRKMNRRQLANDMYMPSMENETIGEIVVGIDTSGSIGSHELSAFASELASVCTLCNPEQVRILWWDTQVHGEQVFKRDGYENIASVLKPIGGGGTIVSAVSKYINEKSIKAECVLMFTDGYLEHDIEWNISAPTLWMIVGNNGFEPPAGKKVIFDAND